MATANDVTLDEIERQSQSRPECLIHFYRNWSLWLWYDVRNRTHLKLRKGTGANEKEMGFIIKKSFDMLTETRA